MPQTKEFFDSAKEKANRRLNDWIQSVKEEKQPVVGIPRLHLRFGGVFKKIEWKPRHAFLPARRKLDENDYGINRSKSRSAGGRGNESRNSEKEPKFSSLGKRSSIPRNLHLEDQRLYDSNSSNLSSRLEHREEIGKSSGYTTAIPGSPVIRTPYSICNAAEDERDVGLDSLEHIIRKEPELPRKTTQRQGSMAVHTNHIHEFLRRRRRRKTKEDLTKSDTNDHVVLNEDNDEPNLLIVDPLARKKSSLHILEGSRPKSAATSIKVNYNTKKDTPFYAFTNRVDPDQTAPMGAEPSDQGLPIEVVFRRTHKLLKINKMMNQSNQDVSNVPQIKEPASEERRAIVLGHFRKLIRLLIHVRVLLNVSRLRIEEEEKSKEFKRIDGDCELSFDPTAYKTAFSCGGLNTRIRRVLKKNPEDRDEEDARMLMEVLLRMPVFIKYPIRVKQWLARQMWYDCFQDGRVIIKQGDPGSRMYFVVSGEVDLKRTDVSLTGEENSYHLKTLTAGATFGEIALIRDMNREFTAICKGTSEILSLSKAEFNNALRHRWEQDYNIRFNFLRSCDIFDSWSDRQLQICADSSELKEYNDKKVILGDTDKVTDSVYFIRKGRCDIVRRIIIYRHQSPYLRPNLYINDDERRRETFLKKSYATSRRIRRKEVHFLTVTTLQPGNYFGAGENLRDTFILSRGKTECVVTNSAQFSIQGKSEQLRTLARDRENMLPSNQSLYKQFQINRRWYEYKDRVLKEILNKKKPNSTSIKDVPRTIKTEPRIPDNLINYRQ